MAEYNEREALIAEFKRLKLGENSFIERVFADGVYAIIEQFPAADVVPVVRCKDCKHFNHECMECENEAVSTDHEGGAQYSLDFWLDDVCSYGERKDGECG